MATTADTPEPTLAYLRRQFAAGDIDGARRALMQLSPEGVKELEGRLGAATVARMFQATRKVRGPSLGRVVVIHGIMGGKLASIDSSGDDDHVWLNYPRLVFGRIADFKLDASGEQADPSVRIETRGLLDEYMPLVLEIGQRWDVLPVAFDWRLDIDKSAAALDIEIRRWAPGQPVHIVAHSMGGVVSRRFMQMFPSTWDAMKDPDKLKRGGRLVMLGTPNRGSFAIPFVLTGEEKTVKMLETFDLKHNMEELLEIINTFPGSYQMLPSPELDFGDERHKLFDRKQWGSYPVTQQHLDRGRKFQQELFAVKDPDRLIYVAGYDRETPYRVRVDGPGKFSYQETMDGDGRVPHELGLLPGVPTFYVAEKHGDLPANGKVLSGIHDLLATGTTGALDSKRPASRGVRALPGWRKASEIAPVTPAVPQSGVKRSLDFGKDKHGVIEAEIIESFIGGGRGMLSAPRPTPTPATQPPATRKSKKSSPPIKLEVMWADITQVDGEVCAAGHYEGLEPQAGELSLDLAISGVDRNNYRPDDLVITSHTRRGILRGAVADINFFPWIGTRKTVVIAGMGHPGSFGPGALQRTTRALAESVACLPKVATVNLLLIGSGNGNLSVSQAVMALLAGLKDALLAGLYNSSIRRIRIVEYDLRKAQLIAQALAEYKTKAGELQGIQIADAVVEGRGGRIGEEIAMSAVLLASASRMRGNNAAARRAGESLLQGVSSTPALRQVCREALGRLAERPVSDLMAQAGALDFGRRENGPRGSAAPTRISFVRGAGGICAAAISETAVVPERMMPVDWTLVDEIVQRMTDPADVATIADMSRLMARLFVPADFRQKLGASEGLIVELDRDTGRIHWEMLDSLKDTGRPLALDGPVARQLRTSYSPTPPRPMIAAAQLRALVIGDPGDPDKGYALDGARQEALEVASLLRKRGVQVDLLVGAPNAARDPDLTGITPATVLEVLRLLEKNNYDILHYAGHGDFDPANPEQKAGWIFGDRYFTARELASLSRAPALVVANACLSGLTSNKRAGGDGPGVLRATDDNLLPGLVDEFFKRGVRNYVGTAWPVSDTGAILFCATLYESLLGGPTGAQQTSLGEAMLNARRALKEREDRYGALWAAYHHYGDPAFVLRYAAS